MTTRRQILTTLPAAGAAFSLSGAIFSEGPALAQQAPAPLAGHFHPKGKAPSEHTVRVIQAAKDTLRFDDTRDLEEQARGLIAEMPDMQIMADAGNVAFDMSEYQFLNGSGDFDSIHPSLTWIARLNNNYGL